MSLLHRVPFEQIWNLFEEELLRSPFLLRRKQPSLDASLCLFLLFFLVNIMGCKSNPREQTESSQEVIETAARSNITFELLPVNSIQRIIVQKSTYSDGLVVETLAGALLKTSEELKIVLLEDFIPTPLRGIRELKPGMKKPKEPVPVRLRISLPNKPFEGIQLKPTLQFLDHSGYHQFKEDFEMYVPNCEKGDALGLAYISNDTLVRRKNVVSLNDEERTRGSNESYFTMGNIVCIKIQEINE